MRIRGTAHLILLTATSDESAAGGDHVNDRHCVLVTVSTDSDSLRSKGSRSKAAGYAGRLRVAPFGPVRVHPTIQNPLIPTPSLSDLEVYQQLHALQFGLMISSTSCCKPEIICCDQMIPETSMTHGSAYS